MSPTHTPLVAGRYRLVRPLGEGGMGRVWLARDEVLHRDVAIKEVVPPSGLTEAEREQLSARSLREARAVARLSHPNVVRIYDVVRKDQWPLIVMEYVPSRSLDQVIREDGPMPPADAARIGLGILAALREAHRAGVLHRDVKPGNVLLGENGRVVLTDFGLATLEGEANVTRSGLILGSPAYIAPERARDGTSGPESDLWSLGATIYAAVEGHSPYSRTSAIATLAALATEEPEPPTHAGPLRPVLKGLLRKDPAARIGLDEAEQLLRRALDGRTRRAWRLPGLTRAAAPVEVAANPPVRPEPPTSVEPQGKADVPAEPAHGSTPTPAAPPGGDAAVPVAPAAANASAPTDAHRDEEPSPVPVGATTVLPEGAPAPGGGSRRRTGVILGAAAVALAVLAAVIVLANHGGPGGSATGAHTPQPSHGGVASPSGAPSSPAPSAQTPSPATPTLPAGWHFYHDRTGFTVAVPNDWWVERRGTIVYFHDPNSGRLLGIDQTDHPKPDPVADWTRQEQSRVSGGDFPDYQRIAIRSVDYAEKAADWEFVYTNRDGVRTHVINRGAVFNDHLAYGIWWSTPDSQWDDNLDNFRLVTSTFQPAD
ncbi:MAG TPA: protein kinase [Micromonosporaceae bacterium]